MMNAKPTRSSRSVVARGPVSTITHADRGVAGGPAGRYRVQCAATGDDRRLGDRLDHRLSGRAPRVGPGPVMARLGAQRDRLPRLARRRGRPGRRHLAAQLDQPGPRQLRPGRGAQRRPARAAAHRRGTRGADLSEAEIIVFDVPMGVLHDTCTGDRAPGRSRARRHAWPRRRPPTAPCRPIFDESGRAPRHPSEAVNRVTDVWQFLPPDVPGRRHLRRRALHVAGDQRCGDRRCDQHGIPVSHAYDAFTGPEGDCDPVAAGGRRERRGPPDRPGSDASCATSSSSWVRTARLTSSTAHGGAARRPSTTAAVLLDVPGSGTSAGPHLEQRPTSTEPVARRPRGQLLTRAVT